MLRALSIGLAVLAALAAAVWLLREPRESGASALPTYWDVPDFEFADQAGRRVTPGGLQGSVWIADFVFTRCTAICPTMTAKMVRLQRELASPRLRFVSFSVDPAHDTPEVLAEYAQRWSPGESRWILLATDDAGLERTAQAIGVTVEAVDDAENPILHSNRFFLIDARGKVRGLYDSDDDGALARLVEDARTLLAAELAAGDARGSGLDGAGLFAAYGCAACHADARLAPPLEGLSGRTVALQGGATRVADEAYLRESILEPAAALAAGYRATMPSYRSTLDEDELARLVEHLHALAAPGDAPPAETPIEARDPVCRMRVTAVAATPTCEHAGRRYWFCCDDCLADFQADPARYLDE